MGSAYGACQAEGEGVKTSLPAPTAADRERFDRLRELGCIVSRVYLKRYAAPDVHHLLSGGVRISHQATIPLSPWFHRGVVPLRMTAVQARERFGPSKARNPEQFRERYGSDEELLAATNQLLEAIRDGKAAWACLATDGRAVTDSAELKL